jgi:hypothetical protein
LWFINATDAMLDDFGGGTISSEMQSTSMGGTIESQNAETSLTPEQLNMILTDTDLFWQGIPLDATEESKVIFVQISESANWQKPRSNGIWGQNTIQVMYDVPNGRVQLWRYDAEKGWMQVGKDISVKFAEGDVFTVRIGKNGALEIYQNGKLLGKREVIP